MKHVGIITIQKCDNFGSDLQAYALQRKLQLLGYDAENIDYLFYKNRRHIKTRMSRPCFHVSLINRIKEYLYPKKQFLSRIFHLKEDRNRRKKFDSFVSSNFRLSREYRTVDDLYKKPPQYDVYIVGSDELWNPRCNSTILPYFLDFAPKGASRISYAASTGGHDVYDEQTQSIFKRYLDCFYRISMREKSSCEYFSKMLCRAVEHVVDPTLLLTAHDWDKVAAPVQVEQPCIVVYDLISSPTIWAVARRIAASTGQKIVRVCGEVGMRKMPSVVQYSEIGPGEFISLISKASCVITNSFHGTVFAILYQRPFYFIVPSHMTDSGRVGSLLQSLGLEERMLWEKDADRIQGLTMINYEEPFRRLEGLRRSSVEFLTQTLA